MKMAPFLTVAAAAGLIAGCASHSGYSSANQPAMGAAGSSVSTYDTGRGGSENLQPDSDHSVALRIKQELNNGPLAGPAADVNVFVQDGVATLTGSVPDEQARQSIDSVVSNTHGVVSVQDRMATPGMPAGQVYAPATQYPPNTQRYYSAPTGRYMNTATGDIFSLHVQGLNETDRTLAQRILQGLRTDTQLSSILPSVNINVANGQVVLQGTVQSQQQKQAIVSTVREAAGGSNVQDELNVAGP